MDLLGMLPRAKNEEEKIIALKNLEDELGFMIPPFLRMFYKSFETNSFSDRDSYRYFDADKQRARNFMSLYHEPSKGEVGVLQFFEMHELSSNMKKVYEPDHSYWNRNFVAVAECFGQGYLQVGVGIDNLDKVFVEYPDEDEIKFVADNIFQYLIDIKVEINEKSLSRYKESRLNDLYKNWNEDFWRIKGDEIT